MAILPPKYHSVFAVVAQLAERNFPKVKAVGSIPIYRSNKNKTTYNMKNLYEHIALEFGYNIARCMWSVLSETRGRITHLDQYLKAIDQKVYDAAKNADDGEIYNITLDEDDFAAIPDKFFDRITISIRFSLAGGFKTHGYFDSDNSGIDSEGNAFVTINASVSEPDYISAVEKLNVIVGHELIHARHEIGLLKSTGKTISGSGADGDYRSIYNMLRNTGEYDTDDTEKRVGHETIGSLLYITCPSEMNAFVGECYSELLGMKDDIKDSYSAFECVKKTEIWRMLEKRCHSLSKLEKIKSPLAKVELVDEYCNVLGIRNMNYTFDDMVSDLRIRLARAEETVMKKVSKMACDAYYKGKNHNPRAYNSMLIEVLCDDRKKFFRKI